MADRSTTYRMHLLPNAPDAERLGTGISSERYPRVLGSQGRTAYLSGPESPLQAPMERTAGLGEFDGTAARAPQPRQAAAQLSGGVSSEEARNE
jgi:hypothetical protein